MSKVINIFFLLLVLIFFLTTYRYYFSNKNIESKEFNRNNIDQIINQKISDLPILENDTSDVVEFNDTFNMDINNKKRSFWKLFKD